MVEHSAYVLDGCPRWLRAPLLLLMSNYSKLNFDINVVFSPER